MSLDRISRTFEAELLTKDWLAGVQRAWEHLTNPHIETWQDVFKAFDGLLAYIKNLRAQVNFVRRAPKSLETALDVQFDRIEAAIKDNRYSARHWHEVATGIRDWADPAEGEKMFELYRTKFPQLLTTRFKAPKAPSGTREGEITELIDKLFADLRSDARKIDKSLDVDPEGTESTWGQPSFKEFDLYGMKIVVNDKTVTAKQIRDYIRLLDEAYALLRAKKLHKAWYGTVLIECESCGGENPNTSRGVGGNYTSREDVVRIFTRPARFVIELVLHELGHRYWFKSMDSGQRAKFEDLVRAPDRNKHRPKVPMANPIQKIYWACKQLVDAAMGYQRRDLLPSDVKRDFNDLVAGYVRNIQTLVTTLSKYTSEAGIRPLAEDSEKLAEIANSWTRFEATIKKTHKPWDEAFKGWAEAVEAYARRIANEAQKFDPRDESRVAPVSDYGESNIREAFAEVFMHYVMEREITRDQLESFRSVISSMSSKVVARFLKEMGIPSLTDEGAQ
jgi:hypothetical protein